MNLIDTFQELVARVPDLVQPLIVALAAAVPFIEGQGAAAIGIVGGSHPVIAAIAAVIGNFACVAVLVFAGSHARNAVVTRRRDHTRQAVAAGGVSASADAGRQAMSDAADSPRKAKFHRALLRYGVPGVSLLGPLLLPTQFTATMLAAVGVGAGRILMWQTIAIIGWTIVVSALVSGVVHSVN